MIGDGKAKTLKQYGLCPESWLWCLHCERFFQAKDLTFDDAGNWQGCFWLRECGGSGIGVDVYAWDSWPKQNPDMWEHWPKSEVELKHGLSCPLYSGGGIIN